MAARRPWRTAAFADLSRDSNDDDEEMPDARASGKITGTMFTFGRDDEDKPSDASDPRGDRPAKDKYNIGKALRNQLAYDDERNIDKIDRERSQTRDLLDKIGTKLYRKYNIETGEPDKGTQVVLRMSDLFSPTESFKRLKVLILNLKNLKTRGDVNAFKNHASLRDTVFSARLHDILDRITRHFDGTGVKYPGDGNAEINESERNASEMVENVVLLKEVYDLILNTESQLRASTPPPKGEVSIRAVDAQEPPFYPLLSEDEKNIVWAWTKARENALHVLYEDPTYIFAVKVAGLVNMNEFGVDKLISASHRQSITPAEFEAMPPAHYDDPRISSERSSLFGRYLALLNALQVSKIKDLKRQQRSNNSRSIVPEGQTAPIIYQKLDIDKLKRTYQTLYGILDEDELPSTRSEPAYMETMILSPETRQLQFNLDTVEKALKGIDMDNSRKRLLWATNWMQRPEVLLHGDLTPLFLAALGEALFRIHQFAPQLSAVDDFDSFINSTSFDVVHAFADSVATEILRIKFYSPTRTQLDKMGQRIDARDRGLLRIFKRFYYDAQTKTVKDSRLSAPRSQCTDAALYAF